MSYNSIIQCLFQQALCLYQQTSWLGACLFQVRCFAATRFLAVHVAKSLKTQHKPALFLKVQLTLQHQHASDQVGAL